MLFDEMSTGFDLLDITLVIAEPRCKIWSLFEEYRHIENLLILVVATANNLSLIEDTELMVELG